MPSPLNGSDHFSDCALIPMQMLTAPYTEAGLTDEIRAKYHKLYAPHMYTPKSTFPPHDKNPRRYTYWLEEGLSIGGVEFDEDQIGGPKGIAEQFNPGVVQWDAGNHGFGCGWLSVSYRCMFMLMLGLARKCLYIHGRYLRLPHYPLS